MTRNSESMHTNTRPSAWKAAETASQAARVGSLLESSATVMFPL